MSAVNNPWSFLGFDLRNLYLKWRASWVEFFYSKDSMIAKCLAEPVKVYRKDVYEYYLGDQAVEECAVKSNAVFLPEDICLTKTINVPASVECDILGIISLEVKASSPFSEDETCYGWRVLSRTRKALSVELVIVSNLMVQGYLRSLDACSENVEVWYESDLGVIEINGFGELARIQRYEKKLRLFGFSIFIVIFLLLLLPIVPTAFKYIEMKKVGEQFELAKEGAAMALDLREKLLKKNEVFSVLREIYQNRYHSLEELERLSILLPDDAYSSSITMKDNSIRLEGLSDDAASLMQVLIQEPRYSSVTSPSAFRKEGRLGKERFIFDIKPLVQADQ